MIKIGEFSKLAKTTIKTLRFYDEIGLFKPIFVDDNGYRYYDICQLEELLFIVELRNMDICIDDIKQIASGNNTKIIFQNHLKKLTENLHKTQRNIELLQKFIANGEKGEFMENYKANIIDIPDYDVYYRHGVIPSMSDLFDFVLKAGDEARQNNPTLECENYCYITYSAKEYKEKDVELEYVEAVKGKVNESENIKAKHVSGGKALSVMHKGSYANLNKAYAFALNEVKQNGYEIIGDIREVYIDGCWNKDTEDEYLTEIQIPIN